MINKKEKIMIWKKYKNAIVFLIVTLVGIGLYIYDKNAIGWTTYNMLGVATALALAILALMTYIEYAKGEDIIKIYFQVGTKRIYTKLYTQRKHFTRGEVMGMLRMIHESQGTYKIKDFNENPDILQRFNMIQNGTLDELCIVVLEEELKQFPVVGKD